MIRQSLITLLLLFTVTAFGQTYSKKERDYQPKTFDEALTQLDKIYSDSNKIQIKNMTENEFIRRVDFSTGLWIRNEWLYDRHFFNFIVKESALKKELISKGLFSNDDMSGLILRSYHRKLTGKELAVDQQIKDVHQWYINMNNPEWRKQQADEYWTSYMKGFNVGDTLTNHIYYKRNWLGEPKKNTIIESVIVEKRDRQLKIDIINFGGEIEKPLVFEEINCKDGDCWIDPHQWKHKAKQ